MLFKPTESLSALFGLVRVGLAAHGDGAEGTIMGPVAFLWPEDRPWSAAYDNIGPCGSSSSVENRTQFPLGAIGSIELTIADEAYNLAVRIAYGNNPITQDDFHAVKSNVSTLEPGHQCYSLPSEPSTVSSGSNATIQLEYWADDSDKDESFFACADITFVDATAFTEQVLCFNVTASDFETPSATATTSTTPATSSADATPAPASANADQTSTGIKGSGSGGLSGGAKAGIAVGSIAGAALIFATIFFILRRKGKAAKDAKAMVSSMEKPTKLADAQSIGSARTAH